tara:strand:+ start:373 stop:711 length:339 start_codon:yes stop_codon:yes gene_type:complete
MKITRRQLRRLLRESSRAKTAGMIADKFLQAGDSNSLITHVFEAAVTLGHAKEGTLDIFSVSHYAGGGVIVSFYASDELDSALRRKMSQYESAMDGRDGRYPGMYYVAYSIG